MFQYDNIYLLINLKSYLNHTNSRQPVQFFGATPLCSYINKRKSSLGPSLFSGLSSIVFLNDYLAFYQSPFK